MPTPPFNYPMVIGTTQPAPAYPGLGLEGVTQHIPLYAVVQLSTAAPGQATSLFPSLSLAAAESALGQIISWYYTTSPQDWVEGTWTDSSENPPTTYPQLSSAGRGLVLRVVPQGFLAVDELTTQTLVVDPPYHP